MSEQHASEHISNANETSYDFNLSRPIEHSVDGESVEATFVHFVAPTSRDMGEVAPLNQAFFRAVPEPKEGAKKVPKEERDDLMGSDVLSVLARSKDVELADVYIVARKLFMKVATLEGDKKLTAPIFDKFSAEDFANMVGEYLIFFVLASSLKD